MNAEERAARDDDLIEFIDEYLDEHRFAPTVREIGKQFGQSSSSTTKAWLDRVRREGRIDWIDGDTRTLHTVVGPSAISFDLKHLDVELCPACNHNTLARAEVRIITNETVSDPIPMSQCVADDCPTRS